MERKFEAILFDMDGVLVDSMGNHAKAWTTACAASGIDVSEEELYRREGEAEEKSAKEFIKAAGMMLTKARVKELIRRKNEYFATLAPAKLFPGAEEVILSFHDAGYKIGVVTGSLRNDFQRMLPSGILDLLDLSICGDELLHGKPNPEPYLKAVMSLGIPANKVIVIENAPFGIQSAKGAGTHIVAVRSYLGDADLPGAHQYVDNIKELPRLFGLEEIG